MCDKRFEEFPAHTDDNYKNYYIGFHDGAVAQDNYEAAHDGSTAPYKCPSGHTQEYCSGYIGGEADEGYLLNDA